MVWVAGIVGEIFDNLKKSLDKIIVDKHYPECVAY
jgi:hypothetical protein